VRELIIGLLDLRFMVPDTLLQT